MTETMNHYNDLQTKLNLKQKQDKQYMNPNDYDTIFEDNYSESPRQMKKVFLFLLNLKKT